MAAPITDIVVFPGSRTDTGRFIPSRWSVLCALLFLPLTAMFHNVVFYRAQCMLNGVGNDYSLTVVASWLSRDPSPWVGVLAALAVFHLGNRVGAVRALVPPFLLAFLPLTVWIWDIPGTGRMVCHLVHDVRPVLGVAMHSWHLYALGAGVYFMFLARVVQRHGIRGIASRPSSVGGQRATA